MASLFTLEQKKFIAIRLGEYDAPREIASAFAVRFPDTRCGENDVIANDPRIVPAAPEVHEAFWTGRRNIILDPDAAPFADIKVQNIALSKDVESLRANNQKAESRIVMRQLAELNGHVGAKGAGGKVAAADSKDTLPVLAITRTVIDPVQQAERAE